MKKLLRALRVLLGVALLLSSVTLLLGWWVVRQSLPQLYGEVRVPGLKAAVSVDRDSFGVPRIRAESEHDLLMAQGYVVAQDRLWQMDLLRRVSAGELAEIFGEQALALDRESRILGFRVAAERAAAVMTAEERAVLESYARGVNRYIEERRARLPVEFRILGYQPREWKPADSLLIGLYMWNTLTSTWEKELGREAVAARVGPERERDLYHAESPLDHFIVGGESPSGASAGNAERLEGGTPRTRGAQLDTGNAGSLSASRSNYGIARSAFAMLGQFASESEQILGSNNWVVSGEHTQSGKPMLANDMHLPLSVPSTWYIIQLQGAGWNVKGFALPGVPMIIVGHNERMAWGYTNNGADVQDLYVETFHPQNPKQYRVNGGWKDAEVRRETIAVKGRAPHTLEVVVTRHGPIVHREKNRAYALRWVVTEPGGLSLSNPQIGRAKNWTEFLGVMRGISGPAQNTVYADVEGNIGYIVGARVPLRKKGDGSMPVPGNTDESEWTGTVPFDELPKVLNPPGGIIGTANARVLGPRYAQPWNADWASPYRTERIYQVLKEGRKFQPAEFIALQADIVSLPHKFIAEELHRAANTAPPKEERARRLAAELKGWHGRAEAKSVLMAFVEFTRRALLRKLLKPYLGDEIALYDSWRATTFVENVLRQKPARWLERSGYASYEEMLSASMDAAVGALESRSRMLGFDRPADPAEWRWGRFIALEILHPMARSGFLRRHWSIAGVVQSGGSHTVKQTGTGFGVSERFVADLSNWDHSLMNIPTGQSGQYLSRHYDDQFEAWYQEYGLPSPFSDRAWEAARVHSLRLVP